MGGILSRKAEVRILVLGLDNAGKTSWVKWFNNKGNPEETIPTIGFSVEKVKSKKYQFNMWDVGGQDIIRHLWRHYYGGTQGLVFIVDSTDTIRVDEASSILKSVAQDGQLQYIPILVLCNKIDLPNALTPNELTQRMDLKGLKQTWSVMPVSAKTGQGCDECVMWLCDNIKAK